MLHKRIPRVIGDLNFDKLKGINMATGSLGLHFENSSRIKRDDYSLHFEEQEALLLPSLPAPSSKASVVFLNPPLNQGLWKDWNEASGLQWANSGDGSYTGTGESENFAPEVHSSSVKSAKSIDWTDVLGWSLSLASIGLGVYLVKQGYDNGSSNLQGLGVGLATAGSTWGTAEILNRSFCGGERPDHRGSLFVTSLVGGTLIGVATKFTSLPANLPPPSAFKNNVSLDGKNPVNLFNTA